MNDPKVTFTPDSYVFLYDDLEVVLDRFLEDRRDGLKAEVEVRSSLQPAPGLVHYGRITLTSTQSRSQFVHACQARVGEGWHDETDFAAIVGDVCVRSLKHWREGDPPVSLLEVDPSVRPKWLLHPFVEYGGPTVLFAYGESGKSLFALAMAATVASGRNIVGELMGEPANVLYLDWEADKETHAERLFALCRGAGIGELNHVYHHSMVASIAEAGPAIRKLVATMQIGMIVIDSMGMARSGSAVEAEPTVQVYRAVRSLRVPALIVDHIAKDAGDGNNPYGSIYTNNLARITWRLDAVKEEGKPEYSVALTNKKGNNMERQRRLAYRVAFDYDESREIAAAQVLRTITIETLDPLNVPEFNRSAPLAQRLLHEIASGGPMVAEELADQLGEDQAQVRARLADLRKKGAVKKGETGKWGLSSNR